MAAGSSTNQRPLRVLHLDIKTYLNFGDTLLFEAVRQLFAGFAGGSAFEITSSRNLRRHLDLETMDEINANYDLLLIGGGGLFLRDTNPNQNSGWQWDIRAEVLAKLEIPLALFAVGNNRFAGSPDFAPVFRRHMATVADKAVFFGLRNTGSMQTLAEYLPFDGRDLLNFQPCGTTLGNLLHPDLVDGQDPDEKRVAVQAYVDPRQAPGGYTPGQVFGGLAELITQLRADGFTVETVQHTDVDGQFPASLVDQPGVDEVPNHLLHGSKNRIYGGLEYYRQLPMMIGTRGHAQMIPFGCGVLPLSVHIHPKNGYFAADIERSQWDVDPHTDDWVAQLRTQANEAFEDRVRHRRELRSLRASFAEQTLANLGAIYQSVTGHPAQEREFSRVEPTMRSLSNVAYEESMFRHHEAMKIDQVTADIALAARARELATMRRVAATGRLHYQLNVLAEQLEQAIAQGRDDVNELVSTLDSLLTDLRRAQR